MTRIILFSSAVRVHDSQAYMKMDVTRERIGRILELRKLLRWFQTGCNIVNAAVACAFQESIQTFGSGDLNFVVRSTPYRGFQSPDQLQPIRTSHSFFRAKSPKSGRYVWPSS